jgi:tetratricopeptide (TPR) repeat protein/O-antigen ligase
MVKTKLGAFCDKLIEAGWLAAVVIVPLFFDVYSSRVFEPDKITLLRSIAVTMVVAWVIKLIEQGFGSDPAAEGVSAPRMGIWKRISAVPLALPTLALVVVYLISTVFSVVPRTSLLGSYQRLQGTYSMLSYIVVFAMMLQGIRKREQVERFVTVIVLTSVPIALYGILQHYGLDPLPWGGNVRRRVAANMGNAIFVAAYLIMALPLTLYRTVESFTEILTSEKSRFVDIILGAAYIFILAIQGICIFFSQSRGPWLGLIGGLFFFFLVLAVVRRWRWLVWTGVVAILAVALFLVVFNLPSSPLHPLRDVPYIGRLGRVLDPGERTSRVRLLIWQGAIQMILPHAPLEKPDGTKDAMNWARPLIGYGPESMYVAYNRFYPPDLAHYEARNASPDRSHNETFDSLVTTGLIGFLVYMWLFMGVFYYGFRWLGVIANTMQRNMFMGCWAVGGVLSALVIGLWQGPEFVGVGLPAGIAAGLGFYLVIWGLFLSRRAEKDASKKPRESGPYDLLIVALVAAVIAHFVEIHFGIAIAATRTYFWSYAALMVVVGYLLPRYRMAEQAAQEEPAPATHQTPSKRRRRQRKSKQPQSPPPQPRRALSGLESVLPYALILALILSTLAYDYVSNQKQLDSPQEIVWTSLTRRLSSGELVPSYGIMGLFLIAWFLGSAIVLSEWLRRGGGGDWRAPWGACLSISVLVAFLFALVIAGRLAGVLRQPQLLTVARMLMGILSSYYVVAFGLILAIAFALLRESPLPRPFWQPMTWWAHPLLVAGLVLVVLNSNLKVVHADIVYKQAEPYEKQDMWDFSIVLHQQALKLAPHEDFYYLFLGRAFLEKAKSAAVSETPARTFKLSEVLRISPQQMAEMSRDDFLNCSETVLKRASELNPLNTDHSANLGRLYRTRGELATDKAVKEAYFRTALEYYAQATSLSPHAAHLFNEWGSVYAVMGDYQAAIEKYEYSLSIDAEYVNTYLSLGDAYMAIGELEQAKGYYLQAVEIDPKIAEVHSVLAYLYGKEGLIEDAIAETQQVLALTTNQRLLYNSYKNLALFYRQIDRMDDAMRAAQEALARAPDNERASIQGLIDQLAGGGVAPETEVLTQQFLSEGEAALNSKQWSRAEEAYQKALGLNPNLLLAHSALSYIYAQQGRLEEAEQENQIVLAAVPGDFATLKNLAIIYRQMKRYDDAISYAQQALGSPQATEEDKQQLQLFINEVRDLKATG